MALVWSRIRSGARLRSLRSGAGSTAFRHFRHLCTSATAMMYFTPNSIDGVEMDPGKCSILEDLFVKDGSLCFDNFNSNIGCHDFSPFSKNIFAKIMTIAYRQGCERSRYFKFDPSSILVTHIHETVLEVGVPISQLAKEREVNISIYQDHIVGPFANMVMSLCLKTVVDFDPQSGAPNMEQCYKEALDLLHRAQTGQWWSDLDEILAHPLFQLLEQKIAYLSLAHVWLNGPKPARPHGVLSLVPFPVRLKTKLTPQAFQQAYSNNAFYLKDYTISYVGTEMAVTEAVNQQDWKAYFIHNRCFGPQYFFGHGTDTNADMVRHCRVIIFHFEDSNMDAYAAALDKPSLKVAIIHLDRTFSLSLKFLLYSKIAWNRSGERS